MLQKPALNQRRSDSRLTTPSDRKAPIWGLFLPFILQIQSGSRPDCTALNRPYGKPTVTSGRSRPDKHPVLRYPLPIKFQICRSKTPLCDLTSYVCCLTPATSWPLNPNKIIRATITTSQNNTLNSCYTTLKKNMPGSNKPHRRDPQIYRQPNNNL